jgi:cytochrome c2
LRSRAVVDERIATRGRDEMAFPGVADPKQRAEIIAYLETLK